MRTALLLLAALGGYALHAALPTASAAGNAPGETALFMFTADASAPDDAPMDETFIGDIATAGLCDGIARALTEHMRESPSAKVGAFGCKREIRVETH